MAGGRNDGIWNNQAWQGQDTFDEAGTVSGSAPSSLYKIHKRRPACAKECVMAVSTRFNRMYIKERKEHPSLRASTVRQIVKDHMRGMTRRK
jgi:hypothetical protein